jgi:hypothetical protein
MRLRHPCAALLLAVSLFLIGPLMIATPTAQAEPEAAQSQTVLFVVSASRAAQDARMEPILIIEAGGYKQPIDGGADAEEITRFADAYYRKGQKYRVLFGGGSAGSLTVTGSTKDTDCFKVGAGVALQTQAKLNSNVMALATNSEDLGRAQGSRRAPTAQERAGVLALAQDTFKQKGVPAALLPSMEVVNLTATDLNGDGKAELIGSFVARRKGGDGARYLLFLLAEPQGNSYRAGLAQYSQLTNKDASGGLSLDEMIGAGTFIERLVDQLDLDGNGTAEVITVSNSLEGVGYTFYKKQSGQWQKFFESGGYRCAF